MNDITEYTISDEEACIAIVTLWVDGEEVAYTLRQGEVAPTARPVPSFSMELDDIPF